MALANQGISPSPPSGRSDLGLSRQAFSFLKDLKKGQVYVKKGRLLRFEFGSIFGLSLKSLHAKKGRLYWGDVWGYPKATLAEAALDSELINKPTRKEGHNYIIM